MDSRLENDLFPIVSPPNAYASVCCDFWRLGDWLSQAPNTLLAQFRNSILIAARQGFIHWG